MAAFEANGLSAFAQRTDPPSRPLPTGPCSLRDANGPCGCQQFWDRTSLELHHGSNHCIPVSERSTSCVCGHHACFHALPPTDRTRSLIPTAHDRLNARQVAGAPFPSQPASQSSSRVEVRATQKRVLLLDQSWDQHGLNASPARFDQFPDRQVVSETGGLSLDNEPRDSLSQASTSGLPPIPSICLLSQDRRVAANDEVQGSHTLIAQSAPGLGLGLSLTANNATTHQSSSCAVILEGQTLAITPENAYSEEERLPSTRTNSILSGRSPANSPGLDPMNQVKYFIQDQDLHLTTGGDTIRDTYRPDEFLHSATEVATPSITNTPDLRAVDEAAQDALPLLNSLFNSISNQNGHGVDNRSQGSISAPLPQLLLAHSSTLAPDELQRLWRALLQEVRSTVAQEVKSYLRPLYNIIISMPNLNNFQRDIIDRLSVIEAHNNSFNVVLPDECRKQHSDNEDRTIALEHRVDELERLLQSIDANQSTTSADRRNFGHGTESFGSNHSTTSSTLVYTGVTREEFESLQNEVRHKAAAMPSPKHPWEVEVVLLPWGPELRGLWYHSDQPIYEQQGTTMEEDEDWTQTPSARRRSSRSHQEAPGLGSPDPRRSSRGSMSNSDMEGGWSSQAISDWAEDSVDDWLSPRAIGRGNGSKDQVVYERLKSRGFVRHIELRSANARDIHATLSKAFHDLLGHLRYTDEDEDPTIRMYPGLRASFVPLRKDFKNARLRFLTPSEMATSALWDARFLTAGVMMRLSGSRKRLYVTQREAYMQYGGEMRTSWTWPELKLLPRYHPDPDSQMEGSDEQKLPQVPNADVVEGCWAFHEDCDSLPASVTSSFSSSHSAQIAMRPADQNWRRSMTPSSILKDRKAQPISPLSEHHPQRPGHIRLRTASDSRADSALPSSVKRRLDASPVKPSSAPQVALRTPSASVVRPKRRRVVAPSSPQPDGDGQSRNTDIPLWAHTPRRSNEPPSPFFSSQPELVRVNSDVASRVGKNAPFAYATPHSGPYGAESAGDEGGDTELDSVYSEKSWPGVDEDAAEQMKYSDGTSGFYSEDDIAIDPDEVDDESEGSSQHGSASEDGDTDVFDHLLDVLGT